MPVLGLVLAEIGNAVIPDPTARDRERWEGEITDDVNELDTRVLDLQGAVTPQKESLSDAAALIAKLMVETCPDGLAHTSVNSSVVRLEYPSLSENDILEAFGDLEYLGLVESYHTIGGPPEYNLSHGAYDQLDKHFMGWDTITDAKALGKLVLTKEGTISVTELDSDMGWSRRRFNPALRLIVQLVGEGRVSQVLQSEYVTQHFAPNDVERAQIRRFVR